MQRAAALVMLAVVAAPAVGVADTREQLQGASGRVRSRGEPTAPPADPDYPAAMPRTSAERLWRLQPEHIFGGMVASVLFVAVVLAIAMLRRIFAARP